MWRFIKRDIVNSNLVFKLLFTVLVIIFISIKFILPLRTESISFSSLLYLYFGEVTYDTTISSLLIKLFPQIYLMYILCNLVQNDLDENGAYLFSRTKKRAQWFTSKIITIFIYILFYILISIVVVFIISLFKDNIVMGDLSMILYAIRDVFIEYLFTTLIFILLLNVLSLYTRVDYSFGIILFIYLIGFLITNLVLFMRRFNIDFQVHIIPFLPTSQMNILYHNFMWNKELSTILYDTTINQILSYFNTLWSFIYNVILLSIVIKIGLQKVNSMDVICEYKE